MDDELIEKVARACAKAGGWGKYKSAKSCMDTPNGNEPEEEREYWRENARAAIQAVREWDREHSEATLVNAYKTSWNQPLKNKIADAE